MIFFILSGPAAASPATQEVLGPAPLAQVGLVRPYLEVQHPNSAPSKEEPGVLVSGWGLLRLPGERRPRTATGLGWRRVEEESLGMDSPQSQALPP